MMHSRRARIKIIFFIFSVIHLAQCKYIDRRVGNVGNSVHKKLPPMHHQGASSGAPSNTRAGDAMESEPLQPIDDDSGDEQSDIDTDSDLDTLSNRNAVTSKVNNKHCWFPMKTGEYFEKLYQLNDTYASDLEEFQKTVGMDNFDKEMLETMLKTRSIAERALQRFRGEPNLIPAGINLGGYQMMRMPQSVLFFHRLKLRNNTRFRVNYLHNDLQKLKLTARLSLNDLHLSGHYERTLTVTDLSVLFYRPSYGQVEFLLKDVSYEMEANYRLLHDRLYIENVDSELKPKDILMRFLGENNTTPIRLDKEHIKEYLFRLQNDLDRWLKDYFNDFLIFFGLGGAKANAKVQEYDNKKAVILNQFADKVVSTARWRLRQLNASSIKIPRFSLFAVNGLEIKLRDGVIRGLDSMYRRTVSTGSANDQLIELVTAVGFSNLKVEYRYDATTKTVGTPPLSGLLVLNGDELIARLKVLASLKGLDLSFQYWQEAKPQSLTIEGPANRIISNFKHLLEHHILSIMSTSLIHYIEQLGTLTRCRPYFIGKDDPMYKNIDSDEFVSSEYPEGNETIPSYPKTTKAPTNLPNAAGAESDKSDQGGKETTAKFSGEHEPSNQDDPPKPGQSDDENKIPPPPGSLVSDDEVQEPPQPVQSDDEPYNPPQPGPSDDDVPEPPQPVQSEDEPYNPPQPGPSDDEVPEPPQPVQSEDEPYNPPQPGPSDDEVPEPPKPVQSEDEPYNPPQPGPSDDEVPEPPQPVQSEDEPYNPPQPGPSDDEVPDPPQPGPSDDETKNPPQPGLTDVELPELSQNSDENQNPSDPKGSPAPAYIVSKNESVELEFPPKSGSKHKETMILNVQEKFSLTRMKDKGGRKVG